MQASRTYQNPGQAIIIGPSINEHKFTGVEKEATRVGQPVLPGIGAEQTGFVWTRRTGERQSVSSLDLLRQIGALLLQTRGEVFALPEHKRVVERGQSLKRGERDVAFGREQACVGAIERLHEWVRHAPYDEPVDARPGTVRTVGLESRVVVNRRVVVFEE